MDNKAKMTELLEFLEPSLLDYSEWISVGMALKEEGFSVEVFDAWSKRDPKRYHAGECEDKWKSFGKNASAPVTGGTVYEIARRYGYTPQSDSHELNWDDTIGKNEKKDELTILEKEWIEGREIHEPTDWNPKNELIRYLSLFDSTENVGYVTETWEKDGKFLPTKGCFDRTAGELSQLLSKCHDICDVIGDYNHAAGAWIRFNPLDGKGVSNANVTEYRYALVESDKTELEKQNAIIRMLELPVAALVYSGGKSLHAVVRIDAANYDEYRKRVDYLYKVCEKNGLIVDAQNRNPSRLSRMPGIERGGKKQFLVDMNIGKASFTEWQEWIEGVNDDLPDPESLSNVLTELPALSPELIEGVLRQGHKMLLSGPSKAGKSFALIELCISIAEGKEWFGRKCERGRVLYLNMELDRASCFHRFCDVYAAMGLPPAHAGDISIWNLRGKTVPLDKLAPKLIRRAQKENYIAVIIDPIYKVITGDENSAEQMSYFCNQFDKICSELHTAVIYCHHHSKGSQIGKRSVDRASGSGVFARDPDALIDMSELEISQTLKTAVVNREIELACERWMSQNEPSLSDRILRDDLCSKERAYDACRAVLPSDRYRALCAVLREAEARANGKSAWRVETTLREFPRLAPIDLWFDYPIHKIDRTGMLHDVVPESEKAPWQKAAESRKPKEKKQEERCNALEIAYSNLEFFGGDVTVDDLAEEMGVTARTVWNRLKENGGFEVRKGDEKKSLVVRKQP